MKTKLLIASISFFLLCFSVDSFAAGLYDNKINDSEAKQGSSVLKGGRPDKGGAGNAGEGEVVEPDPTPVSDGLWLLIGVAGVYVLKTYRDSKKRKA